MTIFSRSSVYLLTTSVAAIASLQPAFAQTAPAPVTAPVTGSVAAPVERLQEIIVTARRTNENLQKVPIAATVLSGDMLEKRRISAASDLQFSAPSLVVTTDPLAGSSTPVFQLRGQVATQGSDDTVVTYLGDIPVNSRAFAGGLFDLQSAQVIRGPQGTLFGKNSTGGAVVFTPRKADTETLSGFVDGTVGNYSYYQIGAGINVPLIEGKLGLRVSGQLTRQDGFVRNLGGPDGADKHNEVVHVSLVATPIDGLRNETFFSFFEERQHQNPLIFTNYSYGLVDYVAGPTIANIVQGEFNAQQQLGPRTINYSFGQNNDDNDVYIVSNSTSYNLGSVTIKNIFGYTEMTPKFRLSQTSTNWALVDAEEAIKRHSLSDEIQVSGETGSLKWIVGGFYSHEKANVAQSTYLFAPFLTTTSQSADDYTSKALFAQGTYDFSSLGARGLKFTAGIRDTWDNRTGLLDGVNYQTGAPVTQPEINNRIKYSNASWTLGLDYQVNRDILVYVASRHSYKAGGLNLVTSDAPPALQTYAPEKLTDLEIGAKTTVHIGDAVVRTNLDVYRGWYKNIQYLELASCGTVASYVVNAAKGSPKGLELEIDASVTRNLRINGFYNRTLGKFDSFSLVTAPGCAVIGAGQNLNGADFGNISKNTAGVTAAYTIPLAKDHEDFVISGNMYTRSDRVGALTEGTNSFVPGYTLFNARLDYENIGGTKFSAGAWIHNIGNKLYVAYRNDVTALTGYDVQAYGDPRTFGIDLKYRF